MQPPSFEAQIAIALITVTGIKATPISQAASDYFKLLLTAVKKKTWLFKLTNNITAIHLPWFGFEKSNIFGAT